MSFSELGGVVRAPIFLGRRPYVLPAQGTALGIVAVITFVVGPTGQRFAVPRWERLARWADHTSTHNK